MRCNETIKFWDGSGLTVAVLSSTYGSQAARLDVLAGLLPGVGNPNGYKQPVVVLSDGISAVAPVVTDDKGIIYNEGRAMLHIVHAIAPNAKLCFAGGRKFPDLVNSVRGSPCNADIIIDDMGVDVSNNVYVTNDGIEAVDRATDAGVLYFTAAGNQHLHNREFPLTFVASNANTSLVPEALRRIADIPEWNQFPAGLFPDASGFLLPFKVSNKAQLTMYWSEFIVEDDLDLYLLDPAMSCIAFKSMTNNIVTNTAIELVNIQGPWSGFIAIGRRRTLDRGASQPELRAYFLVSFSYEFNFGARFVDLKYAPSLVGHRLAKRAITVAAYTYYSILVPALYSNGGSVPLFFKRNGALLNSTYGEIRMKPSIGAVDCTDSSFFNSGTNREGNAFPNFCGTSEAVVYAGAFTALFKQAVPSLDYEQLMDAFEATGTAWNPKSGYGLLNTDAVMAYLLGTSR